jgi:Endonuclease/Exonuclease/phosphatase family
MSTRQLPTLVSLMALLAACSDPASQAANQDPELARESSSRVGIRFSTFNASLNRGAQGQLVADLSNPNATSPGTTQAKNAAETIQRLRPDVVLINEFDFYPDGQAARLFLENYLRRGINGAEGIDYPFWYVAESNTGIHSGFDLNNNGATVSTIGAPGYGDDAFGFGAFPGQFGMIVYSKFPILQGEVRTFQKFLWEDMPGALLPDDPATPAPGDWYSAAELAVFRLSSKSHWDLPIQIGGKVVHFLVSHPTPPVFDGPEDRNGTRNFDEIRFWADYIHPARGRYIYDDNGRRGGLEPGALFVIAGDQNSDPLDGDSRAGAIQQLIEHPLIDAGNTPASEGAIQQAALQGGANTNHRSDPRFDTADFADGAPGNLRADYVLPRVSVRILNSGVFWPLNNDPLFRLVGVFNPMFLGGFPTSDHRLVWVDLQLPGVRAP